MAHVRGTTAGETLGGASGSGDELFGRGGNDIVSGLGGDDLIADGAWFLSPFAREPAGLLNPAVGWSSGGNDTFNGGSGDDRLFGDGGNDTLNGGRDNDRLFGGRGNDTLNGGSGDDTLFDDDGAETIDGGTGTDTVRFISGGSGDGEPFAIDEPLLPIGLKGVFADFEAGRAGIAFDNPQNSVIANASYTRVEIYETGSGTNQRDEIRGDDTGDTIRTFGGDDIIEGRGGADVLDGGAGTDTASYESAGSGIGVNILLGGAALPVDGFPNTDAAGDTFISIENLTGSQFGDFLGGDDNVNTLKGLGNADNLRGYGGADRLDGGAGTDTADYGGFGNANIAITISTDGSSGQGGDAEGDRLVSVENVIGTSRDDRISGDDGSRNALAGAGGDDLIFGRGNDDTLAGGAGFNLLDGGAGDDTADYRDIGVSVTVFLQDFGNGGSAGGTGFEDRLVSIENVEGSQLDDVIVGDGAANVLRGNDGEDTLLGGGGRDLLSGGLKNDVLHGGADGDRLFGGDGIDTASYKLAGASVTASLDVRFAGRGEGAGDFYNSVENLLGSSHADRLIGNGNDNGLSGADGADTLIGGGGGDVLAGGDNIDTASYETATEGVVVDLADLTLNSGDAAGDSYLSIEVILGSTFADTLKGDDANNTLSGSGGADRLFGRGGNDVLVGGEENDVFVGGDGADLLFGFGGNRDTASYADAQTAITVTLDGSLAATGDAVGDAFFSIEAINGAADFRNDLGGDDADNRLQGGGQRDRLNGKDGADIILGGEDDDTIFGGFGQDILSGGADADTFVFASLLQGGDRITDFVSADDTLRIRATGLGEGYAAGQALTADQLVFGQAATGAFGQFIYDATGANGILSFDADGTGAGVAELFIVFTGAPTLALDDFLIN